MSCDSLVLKRHGDISIDSLSSPTLKSCKTLQYFSTCRCYGESGKPFTPFIKAFADVFQDEGKIKYYRARKESHLRQKIILDKVWHREKIQRRPNLFQTLILLLCPIQNEILQLKQAMMGRTPQKGIVVILYLHQCPWGHSHWIISNSRIWCWPIWWI